MLESFSNGNKPETPVEEEDHKVSSLISRNITVMGHRTSMRLEPAMWDALIEICRREKLTIHQLCGVVAEKKPPETSFTAAMRVFAMSYFRGAATEEGHVKVGHGSAFLFSSKRDFAGFAPHGKPAAALATAPQPQPPMQAAANGGLRRY